MMPRPLEYPAMVLVGTVVAAANALHPLFHTMEGGAIDSLLDNATQFTLAWFNSKGI